MKGGNEEASCNVFCRGIELRYVIITRCHCRRPFIDFHQRIFTTSHLHLNRRRPRFRVAIATFRRGVYRFRAAPAASSLFEAPGKRWLLHFPRIYVNNAYTLSCKYTHCYVLGVTFASKPNKRASSFHGETQMFADECPKRRTDGPRKRAKKQTT